LIDVPGDHPGENLGVLNAGKAPLGRERRPAGVGVSGARFTAVLPGVRNDVGAAVAVEAALLSKGSFLVANRARFNFCAERSAFNAAAVVIAT